MTGKRPGRRSIQKLRSSCEAKHSFILIMAHYLFNHTLRFVPLGYNDPPLFLTPPLHANEANDFTHLRYALCCLISLLCSQAELRKTQLVKEGDKITIFLIIANILFFFTLHLYGKPTLRRCFLHFHSLLYCDASVGS